MNVQKMVNDLFGDSEILVLDRTPRDSSCPARTYQAITITVSKENVSLSLEDAYSGDNAIPMRRWLGFEKSYSITSSQSGPVVLNKGKLIEFLNGLAGDIDTLANGFLEDQWDGQNYRPVISDAAVAASERLDYQICWDRDSEPKIKDDSWTVYDAGQWLRTLNSPKDILGSAGIDVNASDSDIEMAASNTVETAREDMCILDKNDVVEELRAIIAEAKEQDEEESATFLANQSPEP